MSGLVPSSWCLSRYSCFTADGDTVSYFDMSHILWVSNDWTYSGIPVRQTKLMKMNWRSTSNESIAHGLFTVVSIPTSVIWFTVSLKLRKKVSLFRAWHTDGVNFSIKFNQKWQENALKENGANEVYIILFRIFILQYIKIFDFDNIIYLFKWT